MLATHTSKDGGGLVLASGNRRFSLVTALSPFEWVVNGRPTRLLEKSSHPHEWIRPQSREVVARTRSTTQPQ